MKRKRSREFRITNDRKNIVIDKRDISFICRKRPVFFAIKCNIFCNKLVQCFAFTDDKWLPSLFYIQFLFFFSFASAFAMLIGFPNFCFSSPFFIRIRIDCMAAVFRLYRCHIIAYSFPNLLHPVLKFIPTDPNLDCQLLLPGTFLYPPTCWSCFCWPLPDRKLPTVR